MKTIEELMAERKAIDEQIRLLKGGFTVNGRAKLDREHFATAKPDEWFVAVKCMETDTGDSERWRSIIRSTDRDLAISMIPKVIEDLKGLLEEVEHDRD